MEANVSTADYDGRKCQTFLARPRSSTDRGTKCNSLSYGDHSAAELRNKDPVLSGSLPRSFDRNSDLRQPRPGNGEKPRPQGGHHHQQPNQHLLHDKQGSAEAILRRLQQQICNQRCQLNELQFHKTAYLAKQAGGGDRPGHLSSVGSTGALTSVPRPDGQSTDNRRYSAGQTLPQRLPSHKGNGTTSLPGQSQSVDFDQLVYRDGHAHHDCKLKQLDGRVLKHQQLMMDMQQKPLDMAVLERIFWEQKKITQVR